MKLSFYALLLLAMPSLYAQNQLSGTITDRSSGEPVAFASVYFPQLEKGVSSDESGNFSIGNLPNGNYKIVIASIGFETLSQNLTLPSTTSIQIQLAPSAIEMAEIIVSTPFHKLQSENVMKVERESVNQLKSKGAVTLAEGLSSMAGVESITTGTGIGKPVIRGLSSSRVLVYTQGVRFENQQFGDEHGLGINDAGIESVEIIKGPASLLYGSDALGGVLYLNPEKFANANESHADINGNYSSNTKGYTTNLGYKTSGEQFKFLFRGSQSEHSDYETEDYRVTNTRFKEQDFKSGVGFQNNTIKTELRYNANRSKLGIPESVAEQSTARTPLLPYQDITNHVLSSKSTVFFNNSSLDVNIGLLYNDRKEFEEEHHHHDDGHDHDHDHDDDGHDHDHDDENKMHLDPALHMKLKTLNFDVKYSLPIMGKFETIVGTQGMLQSNSNYGEESLIPNATTKDIGVLATSHIHFEKADIQLGARFDTRKIEVENGISRSFNSFNGAAGIKTDIAEKVTARLNFATGFRAPNLAELTSDGGHQGTNRYEIGDANLKNEQNFQTDLSIEYANEHFELFANGFYNLVNNYIYLSPNGNEIDGTPVFEYVQNDAKLYGGEIGFHLHPHPIHWLHLESSFETVIGQQKDDTYLPLIPANSWTNTLRAEFSNKIVDKGYIFVTLKSTFDQDHVSLFETETQGYDLLSAGIGGTVKLLKKDLSIALSATNLTNETYVSHLSRLKPDGIYNMGRNINLGLKYQL
ncbi:MAG TPA: TonB-dependent receptor [Aquaticitalea sp.]|nr:TonB-dependent receptor [Aquaticitalea sp.]HNU58800.1 TonB-dependent receptor [Aquaticitalea sp.]